MSMLSAQTKRLRKLAEQIDWELPEAAYALRDAVDTIDELRMRCQELQEREWSCTCHNVHKDSVTDLAVWFECSECGNREIVSGPMRYCCNCGRRIVP